MRKSLLKLTARLAVGGTIAAVLAGCSMGPMFGGGSDAARTNAELANTTASADQIAQAQATALPAIATQCPPIKVRPGGEAMYYYGGGKVGNPNALNYQGVIDEATRNCIVSNGRININMGAVGRVLLGPSGKQTSVTVPLRFAVERNGQAVYSEKFNLDVALAGAETQQFVKVVNDVAIPYLAGDDVTIWVGFDTRR
ncbi:hypothetical protein PSQ90_03535 [Devosia rhodophyticola]|uniref:Lipoprotein n=1 Tax=Devosia rhodophyticola TaxID=3026423 RepID=A0ABY7YYT5_9HYPH|nr:hypothetical protein [Devosia rhodophyticola]WDR06548.1 hypothetical protein PSQ90_03535 [Devosia rhodophyticola]